MEGGYVGTGNLNTDPLFLNAPNASTAPFVGGDYRIQSTSPIIDVASNGAYITVGGNLTTDLDLSKNPRLSGLNIDMGAYEFQKQSVLPVTLLSFKGTQKNDKTIILFWQVASQLNEKQYVLERSSDNNIFLNIGLIAANQELSSNYSFTDQSPLNGINYYRLKIIDLDGNFHYTHTIIVSGNYEQSISIFPLPAFGTVTLKGDMSLIGQTITLIDLSGKELTRFAVTQLPQTLDISILSDGIYWLKTNNGQITKLIVQKK